MNRVHKVSLPVFLVALALAGTSVGSVPETEYWQRAINEASQNGGGRVVIPAGRHLVGELDMRSNVELHLAKGAVLEGLPGLENYRIVTLPFSEGTWSAVIAAYGVTNVAITGEGEVFGNGKDWNPPKGARDRIGCTEGVRARGVLFADSVGIRLEDFTLRDAACWGVVFKRCVGVTARRVKIDSCVNINNDGFDIEAKDVLIEDCDVNSGDDAYCIKSNDPEFTVENVIVRRCVARTHCSALKVGTASHGVIRNVRFEKCNVKTPRRVYRDMAPMPKDLSGVGLDIPGVPRYLTGAGQVAIFVDCVDGGVVENVNYDGITFEGCKTPIFIRGGMRMKRACGIPPSKKRILRNITIRNVSGRAEHGRPSTITGVEGCRPQNVSLEGVDVECRVEVEDDRPFGVPGPEYAGRYPDSVMFNDIRLPAYGLFVDQVDGIRLVDVQFRLPAGVRDARAPIFGVKKSDRNDKRL